jgi:hypothetical protein
MLLQPLPKHTRCKLEKEKFNLHTTNQKNNSKQNFTNKHLEIEWNLEKTVFFLKTRIET